MSAIAGFDYKLPDDWRVLTIVEADKPCGALLIKGPEIHIGVMRPTYLRGLIRSVLVDMLKDHKTVVTTVRDEHVPGHKFVQRIGFVKTRSDGGLTHYELKEARHA